MRKKMAGVLACAAAGVAAGLTTSVVKAGTFVDNFNNGSVANTDTIANFWSTGNYSPGDSSAVTEAVGGPLTMSYTHAPGAQGGPFVYSALQPTEFNFYSAPVTVTLTAAPGGNLIPGTDYGVNNVAETYISIEGQLGRSDYGANRIVMQVSNQNVPMFFIKGASNDTLYNYGIFTPAATPGLMPQGSNISNIDVTSMFLYIDGTHEASDSLLVNFGETWVNTTPGASPSSGTYTFENRLNINGPYDLGPAGGYPNLTQAQLDTMKGGYANGMNVGMEVLNSANDFNSNEAVPVGQITNLNTFFWNNTGATAALHDGQTWDVSNNSNWVNPATETNSNPTGVYTDGSGVGVQFTDQNNGNYAVTLNTTVNPGSVLFSNVTGNYTLSGTGGIVGSGSLTKSGAGKVTLSTANTYSGGTTISAGELEIAPTASPATSSALGKGALTINNNALVKLDNNVTLGSQPGLTPASSVTITSLAITANGTLDIGNNHLLINYGSGADPIASIAALIVSGAFAGAAPGGTPTWTGTGITSSAAAANAGSYGIGYADSADPGNPAGLASGQIEIKYTLLGDANLDGKVNGTDFAILATNFNQAVNGWDKGDFNYDGKANGSDFALLAANFNQGASQSATAALDAFAAANGLMADVPEPASLGLLIAGSIGLAGRRRRSR